MNVLILTDNKYSLKTALELQGIHQEIEICQSPNGGLDDVPGINVREQTLEIIDRFNLVISVHCKQLFPEELVTSLRCINVHPGFNPFNRGWYPQVFSIVNGMKGGVTIHEMDSLLDHGPIIIQEECVIESWDTSGSVYQKIMKIERDMLLDNYEMICEGNYIARPMINDGNVNLQIDFERLRHIDLDQEGTMGSFLDHLRALTHEDYNNAYYLDDSGRKIYVRVILEPEK